MEQNQHPVLTQLNEEISSLNEQIIWLRGERDRIQGLYANDVENIRLILLDALSIEQSGNVDVNILANSIADVLGISLLKEITVTIPLTVEATLLVPADFDIDNLEIGDVNIECYNSDVEDFAVQSFDIGTIEEE